MVYCYECGEQVAENDVFCPYCGISLPPIAAVAAEEDPMDKTIVIEQQTAAISDSFVGLKSKTIGDSAPPSMPQDPINRERLDGKGGGNKTDGLSNDVTAENLYLKTESIDIPAGTIENQTVPIGNQKADVSAPKIIETVLPVVETSETTAVCERGKNVESKAPDSSSSEMKAFEETNLEPIFISTEGEKLENEAGEMNYPAELQTESSLMSYEEAEVKEVLSAEEPEKSVDELVEKSSADFQSFNVEGKSPVAEKSNYGAEASEDSTFFINAPVAERPIAMPEVELPVEDICPPSRYDSVRIMENSGIPDRTLEKKVAEIEAQSLLKLENSIAGKSPQERKEEHSYTTPNIGVSDTDGKNKTKLKPLDEGTVLNGRYEIIRKIGGGGMGAVYLASDKNLGGVLRAVKEMVQSYIEDEQQEKAVNDFKRESLLLTSLDHQSIPTIYDYFFDEKEGRFYLVMKYISGGDLAGRLRSAPESRIDEASVTQWAIQVADVLDYLHNRQPPIVYRDLKPANIMIDGNSGRVMLIDFGIARWVNKEEKGVTAVGTMGYAPPELFSGNVEARSDIYSLGSTLFHLLTGADPQSNPLLIFDFQKHPRPRQINPQLSDQMERILMRAVEYNANKRFASAAEFKKVLEEHQENLKANRVTYGVKEAPSPIALSDQPVFCGFCGQKIVATDMFCAFCGAKQPLAQQGVHSHSEGYAPAPLTAQLLIVGTSELEQPAFRLEKDENLVGRRDPVSNIFPEVDLSKFDPQTKISRRHARIWREGGEFMVEDLGSSNGTYILPVVSDAKRLQPRQPQTLTNGDKIRLGDTTLHFILG